MSETSQDLRPIQLFFSYSHKDESLRDELERHLSSLKRKGIISEWHDRKIGAGSEWANSIDQHLEHSDIILLLVSSDFLASDYCYDIEMKRALEKHKSEEARVIPVILRPADWLDASFAHLQALPRNAKPVTTWSNQDEAWLDIAQSIRNVCQEIQQEQPLGNVSASGSGIRIRCVRDYFQINVLGGGNLPRPNCTVSSKDTAQGFSLSWKRPTIIPLDAGVKYRITAYCDVPLGTSGYVSIECTVEKNSVIPYIYVPSWGNQGGRPSQLVWGQ